MTIQNNLVKYLLSFSTITVIYVYFINLPNLLVNNKNIVNEYYIQNFSKNYVFDFFLIAFYLLIANFIQEKFIKKEDLVSGLLSILITVLLISGSAKIYFLKSNGDSFFHRWFEIAGNKAILYDLILVGAVFVLYHFLGKKITNND